MDAIAVAGITFGVTAIIAAGTFSGWSTKIGRTLGGIETEVKSTKTDVTELKTELKEGRIKNDEDHDKIFSKVNEHAIELAKIQGYHNGSKAEPIKRTRKKKEK